MLPAFLTAEWRNLVMLNFEIDPAILESRLPKGTQLDFWKGKALVSLVGFRFLNTKLLGMTIPLHRNFNEVNLRFYVGRKVGNEWRRGVVFIKEIVPLPAVALVARWIYNENYITLPMRHSCQLSGPHNSHRHIGYSWKWRGQWMEIEADVTGTATPLIADSQEQFITEHYWGYTAQRSGKTIEYGVEHPPWRVWPVTAARFNGDAEAVSGKEFHQALSQPAVSAFVAEGSEITVRKSTRLA